MVKGSKHIRFIYLFSLFMTFVSCSEQKPVTTENELWYAQPASEWMQALPVGNGRMGAMVFGDPVHERLQLNEDSMWPGGPDWGNAKGSPEDLAMLRKLIRDGKVHEADKFIVDKFSYKGVVRSHQTMGDLFIDFDHDGKISNYRRSLSLDSAVVTTAYHIDSDHYTQKVFSSNPDDIMMVELTTSAKEGMSFSIRMDRPLDQGHKTVMITNPSSAEISMKGEVTQYGAKKLSEASPLDYGVKFETLLKVKNEGGTIEANEGKLELKGVKKATLYLVANTSFYHEDYSIRNQLAIEAAENFSFEELLQRHVADYAGLYDRVALDLGGKELDSLPTDKRLERVKEGSTDPDLAAKLFQYGRYLLIASSRPGTNPANLQGIWNEHIQAPWNADYHLNINLQMNYWPAEVTNLSECHLPLFNFADRLMERGRITAREQYGIDRGSIAHHTTDLWAVPWMRAATPYWGSWIHGAGWLAQHYFEHYNFTGDEKFLAETAYPYLNQLTEFYADWLQKDEITGLWISYPETSPENSYLAEDGKPAAVAMGAAMGHQIIAEVFDHFLVASQILKVDDSLVSEIREKRAKLTTGVKIGEDGRILEWDQPWEEAEKGHRHMSHLYALHPGNTITEATKEAFNAAKKTIDYRLAHGGAGTGWSRAWMINFNARLHDSVSAEENIRKFFEISVANNLFDEHPPFQIDGNFGFTAGVAELLLQSHEGFLRVLPALPAMWEDGKVSGLKARGNIEVDLQWQAGKLTGLWLTSANDQEIGLRYLGEMKSLPLKGGKKIFLNGKLEIEN